MGGTLMAFLSGWSEWECGDVCERGHCRRAHNFPRFKSAGRVRAQ